MPPCEMPFIFIRTQLSDLSACVALITTTLLNARVNTRLYLRKNKIKQEIGRDATEMTASQSLSLWLGLALCPASKRLRVSVRLHVSNISP